MGYQSLFVTYLRDQHDLIKKVFKGYGYFMNRTLAKVPEISDYDYKNINKSEFNRLFFKHLTRTVIGSIMINFLHDIYFENYEINARPEEKKELIDFFFSQGI